MEFNIKNIEEARDRISEKIIKTPLIRVESLDEFLGAKVYLKLENLQKTGSFKFRGAMNKILSLSKDELEKGIVCASSGNHGKAIAYGCKTLGIKATVIMPKTAPEIKINAIKDLGAEVILCDTSERFQIAEEICNERGSTLVPPFDDYDVMAGQGTCGLEILEDAPDLDYIVVPVSGGGLIGGIATAVKTNSEKIKIIGAEPKNAAAFTHSLKEGEVTSAPFYPTIADALVSVRPGEKNFPIVRDTVDHFMDVSEEYILKAMKLLLFEGKILAEPSSAIGIGGILEGKYKFEKDTKVCFVISGGSVALEQLYVLDEVEYK